MIELYDSIEKIDWKTFFHERTKPNMRKLNYFSISRTSLKDEKKENFMMKLVCSITPRFNNLQEAFIQNVEAGANLKESDLIIKAKRAAY